MSTFKISQYKELTQLEFINLLMSAGGLTPSDIISIKQNPLYEFFWLALDQAKFINRGDPSLLEGLNLMTAQGDLPNHRREIYRNWPK